MGTVFLVGAGPGDQNLLTMRAQRMIRLADVIVYDRLVSRSILALGSENAAYIDVGKRQGHHPIGQEAINQVLIEEAKKHSIVVRLKGGDPYLFGRGGEEVEALQKADIPFEVVNGIPSPIAVLNYAGFPVTHRDCASNVQIISAHRKHNDQTLIDFSAIAKAGGTMIFLMGVSSIESICNGLMDANMPPSTPAAMIERGTTALMKTSIGSLNNLAEKAILDKISSPALMVVGDVVRYHDQCQWYEKKSLHHARVIVTRTRAQAGRLTELLLDRGAEVMEAPAIYIQEKVDHTLMIHLSKIHEYEYLVFTSENGVETFIHFLQNNDLDIRILGNIKIAAIGKGTANTIKKYALHVDLIPEEFSGKALAKLLVANVSPNSKILALRADQTADDLKQILTEAQIQLTDIPIYRTHEAMKNERWIHEWLEESTAYVMLGSASCARSFAKTIGQEKLSRVHAICIGAMTASEAKKQGYSNISISTNATLDSMVQTLENIHQKVINGTN